MHHQSVHVGASDSRQCQKKTKNTNVENAVVDSLDQSKLNDSMTLEKLIEYVAGLVNERAELQVRLGQINEELRGLFGEKPDPEKETKKVRGGGEVKAKKGGVKHECCGSKQQRHKKSCTNGVPVRTKPAGPEPTWECLECSTKVRSAEQPDKCPSCPGRTMIQK